MSIYCMHKVMKGNREMSINFPIPTGSLDLQKCIAKADALYDQHITKITLLQELLLKEEEKLYANMKFKSRLEAQLQKENQETNLA